MSILLKKNYKYPQHVSQSRGGESRPFGGVLDCTKESALQPSVPPALPPDAQAGRGTYVKIKSLGGVNV